jgi:hypothetical protein
MFTLDPVRRPATRTALLVFALALAVRLVYLACVYDGPASLLHVDSSMWLSFGSDLRLWTGNFERMPGYPLFLGLIWLVRGLDPINVVLVQIPLDAATCVLVLRLGTLFDRRIGAIAGVLSAVNPTQIVLCAVVLGDTLFTFFVVGALLAALRWIAAPDARGALMFALWAAAAALNRALIWPLLLLAPAGMFLVAWTRTRTVAAPLRQAAVFALVAALAVAPVLLRNWQQFGGFALTNQAGSFMALWVVPIVTEAKSGAPFAQTQADVEREVLARVPDFADRMPFEQSRAYSQVASERLDALGWRPMVQAWSVGMAINLLSPAILMSPPVMRMPRTGYFATPGTDLLDKTFNFLFRNDNAGYARLLVLGALLEIPLRLLAAAGLALALAQPRWRLAVAFLCAWIAFILVVSGPVASAKYRLPVEPALSVLAAVCLARLHRDRAGG